MDILKRFIETEDITLLKKPIVFARRDAETANYACCVVSPCWVLTAGFAVCICPYAMLCPSKFVKDLDLQLDDHEVQLFEAGNDFLCHIAKNRKTIPLDKIQDIQVGQDCAQTCFGVKLISIMTGGPGDVQAVFLDSPDEVRAAISLAAKIVQRNGAPKAPNSMSQGGSGALTSRIATLEKLVLRGALTRDELASLRVAFLSEDRDLASLLMEAADLQDAKSLTPAEFGALKAKVIARLG